MLFGKIDFINLLPFHIFLKRAPLQNALKQSINYKKGTPSALNHQLKRRKIDAAVISSIESTRKSYKTIDMGIVAKKHVTSVLVKKGVYQKDPASATSNALAKVLGVEGEVIIGDRALRAYLAAPHEYVDLAKLWNEKTGLPFVFARLSVNKDHHFYRRLAQNFLRHKIRIPHYILEAYAKERHIPAKEILSYLTLISYTLGFKEKKALKRFIKEASRLA